MIDPSNFLSYPVWLSLPMETRYKIADLFGIKVRGVRETLQPIHGPGLVISDGFVHADLAVITKEKMRDMTGIESDDFYVLFNALVTKVEGNQTTLNDNVQQEKQEEVKPARKGTAGGAGKGRKAKGSAA